MSESTLPWMKPCAHAEPQATSQLHGVCIFCYRDRLSEAHRRLAMLETHFHSCGECHDCAVESGVKSAVATAGSYSYQGGWNPPPTMPDVHTEHCCKHGCKYGDTECTVTTGKKKQSFVCEGCAQK